MTPGLVDAPPVPGLLAARARIVDALEAGGVRAATTGSFAAPCVLVEPGDPWSSPEGMPRRLTRWRLSAVAGKSDTEAAVATLAELVDRVDAALLKLPGVQLPTWARPFDAMLGAVPYAVTTSTIQLSQEV